MSAVFSLLDLKAVFRGHLFYRENDTEITSPMLRRRCNLNILTERLIFQSLIKLIPQGRKTGQLLDFVRGKSVFIGREGLAAQLKVNSSQRKEITGCNWGFDFGLFSE